MTHEKIYLRELVVSDVSEKYISWVNDPDVTKFLEIGCEGLTRDCLVGYVEQSKLLGRKNFAVCIRGSDLHIGNGSIFSIDSYNGTFEIGWLIGDKNYWGGLFAPMLIYSLHKYAFVELGLKKCFGSVHKNNIMARMTNRFVGYRECESKPYFSQKNNENMVSVALEISKKEWSDRANILNSLHPNFFDT